LPDGPPARKAGKDLRNFGPGAAIPEALGNMKLFELSPGGTVLEGRFNVVQMSIAVPKSTLVHCPKCVTSAQA
jgi:hypothetical protein